ncbi:Cof-type HAD-IIB family hydrolase [Xylocopilactobacillus apicola]|uniref:Haloacid dehalogenase n=1 Tax=Xylocopilactobacillus apicola TaxID=2932184 RepID=A0AAU9CYH4_9LACO|nr:Cof-type HAD-IIB family hydrolase [Xylocopilactobacillus apicola]BDR59069.1 haloacid dehalogenase [Xylocopilactobacillus apicola]
MIKLIASDMDGTLLNHDMIVPEENIKAIKHAQEEGIEFMIATGRNITEARPLLAKYDLETAFITLNGAQVYDEDNNVRVEFPLTPEWIKKVVQELKAEDLYFEIITSDGIFSDNKVKRINNLASLISNLNPDTPFKLAIALSSARMELMNIKYVDSYEQILSDPNIVVFKIIAFDTETTEHLNAVKNRLLSLPNPGVAITASSTYNIEINDIHAQKGIALKKYAEQRGLTAENVMSLGDNVNDTTMIEYAKYSVAMGNAIDDIKKIATWQTDTNNNAGVAKAIERAIEFNQKS